MRIASSCLSVALVLLASFASAEDKNAKMSAELQGKWKTLEQTNDGQKATLDPNSLARIEIRKDKVVLIDEQGKERMGIDLSIKIDATTDPNLIDVVTPDGSVIEGIFKLEGKRWTICLRTEAQLRERPQAFDSQPGGKTVLVVLEKDA